MTVPDGTMALCAKCHRAIWSWSDRAMLFGHDEGLDVFTYSTPFDIIHWAHWVPDRSHDAVPAPSLRDRVLMCSTCRKPQFRHSDGWACSNPNCPTMVDND